jgi:hypothetical protein
MNRRERIEVIALSVACAAGWIAICFMVVKDLAQ